MRAFSPVLSAILLLLIVFALALTFYSWYSNTQAQLQSTSANVSIAPPPQILSATASGQNICLTVQNISSSSLPASGTITLTSDGRTVATAPVSSSSCGSTIPPNSICTLCAEINAPSGTYTAGLVASTGSVTSSPFPLALPPASSGSATGSVVFYFDPLAPWPMFRRDTNNVGLIPPTSAVGGGTNIVPFPKVLDIGDGNYYATPIIADADNDGIVEVMLVEWNGTTVNEYAFDTGTLALTSVGSWFVYTNEHATPTVAKFGNTYSRVFVYGTVTTHICFGSWIYFVPGHMEASPTVGDVDGDGSKEIIVVDYSSSETNVYLFETSGTFYSIFTFPGSSEATPALADIDGDGRMDIVVAQIPPLGVGEGNVYVIHGDGNVVWTLPVPGGVYASPLVADLDKSGSLNVVIGGFDGNVYLLESNGSVLWYSTLPGEIKSSPAVGDIDADGSLEIVIADTAPSGVESNVYALSNTGKILWVAQIPGYVGMRSPVLVDLNGDGTLETIITDYSPSESNIYAISSTGAIFWVYTVSPPIDSWSPAVGDVDDDNKVEIIVAADSNVYVFDTVP